MRGPGAAIALVALFGSLMLGCTKSKEPDAPPAERPEPKKVDIPNARMFDRDILTGGQPTDEHLEELKTLGYKTIVNLRSEAEGAPEEGERAAALGLTYVWIPVSGAADLTPENAKMLAEAVSDGASRPLVVHCKSGNRVGALFALKAFHVDGKSAEEALAIGRDAGLTSLEGEVKTLLEKGR